jgi:hypothetical protein
MRLSALFLLIALLISLTIGKPAAAQLTYQFTRIADTSGDFQAFGEPPTLNNAGVVAFQANRRTGGIRGVYSGSGGSLTTIAETGSDFSTFIAGDVVINDAGIVAFYARRTNNMLGIYAGNGATPVTIAESASSAVKAFFDIGVNGNVTYVMENPTYQLRRGDGATDGALLGVGNGWTSFVGPAVNASGATAFYGTQQDGDYGIYVRDGSGGVIPIAEGGATLVSFTNRPAINEAGTAAFSARRTGGGDGIFSGRGGQLTTIADTSGVFSGVGPAVSINAAGRVAFIAFLDAGGSGLFTGGDPVLHRVIRVGDALDGSTVSVLNFARFAFNDDGSLAFSARLTDGRFGIYRADPLGVLVSGTVTLEDCASAAFPLTFQFRPTDNTPSFTRTVTPAANGSYSIANVPPNSYQVAVKGSKWLQKVVSVDASTGSVSGVNVDLLGGDANDDNSVDILDLLAVIAVFNTPGNGATDLNCDGSTDVQDLLLLIGNFNQAGDP